MAEMPKVTVAVDVQDETATLKSELADTRAESAGWEQAANQLEAREAKLRDLLAKVLPWAKSCWKPWETPPIFIAEAVAVLADPAAADAKRADRAPAPDEKLSEQDLAAIPSYRRALEQRDEAMRQRDEANAALAYSQDAIKAYCDGENAARQDRDAWKARVEKMERETVGLHRFTCPWCSHQSEWIESSAQRDAQEMEHAAKCEKAPLQKLAKVEAQLAAAQARIATLEACLRQTGPVEFQRLQAREGRLREALVLVERDLAELNCHSRACDRTDACDDQAQLGCDDPDCPRSKGEAGNCCEEHDHDECPECDCWLATREAVRAALSDSPPVKEECGCGARCPECDGSAAASFAEHERKAGRSDSPPAAEPKPDPSDDDAILALVQDLAEAGLRYELNPTHYLGPDADRSRAWWQERFGHADQDIRRRAREALRACGWKIEEPANSPPPANPPKNSDSSTAPCSLCAAAAQEDGVRRFALKISGSCIDLTREVAELKRQLAAKPTLGAVLSASAARAAEEVCDAAESLRMAMQRAERQAPAMHLPAQMEELRSALESAKRSVRAVMVRESVLPAVTLSGAIDEIDRALRLCPVQHDDNITAKEIRNG